MKITIKLCIITCISLLLFGASFASEEIHFGDLFEKARKAVESEQLLPQYNVGIDTAEALVRARYDTPSKTGKSPILQKLLNGLMSRFPTAPKEVNASIEPLTWQEYRLAVQRLIDWKTPQDRIPSFNSWPPSKDLINLEQPFYLERELFQGFIPQRHGIIGELVILLCMAYNLAPYGFPIAFEDNFADGRGVDTAAFIKHDMGHHSFIYHNEFKMRWLLKGGLRTLLHQLPFTSKVIYYLFDKVWETTNMTISPPPHGFKDFKEIYPHLPDIYESLCGSNPLNTKKDLQNAIISFTSVNPHWNGLSILLKHVSNCDELQAILRQSQEPTSPLLRKMKEWGFVYNLDNYYAHLSSFVSLVIFLDQKGESAWPLLDTAHKEDKLSHTPDARPYHLQKIVKGVIEEFLFKHTSNHSELSAILRHDQEPTSPLLKKMKEWGFVYKSLPIYESDIYYIYEIDFADLVIFLHQKSESVWPLLDAAHREGKLAHTPGSNPYHLREIVKRVIKESSEMSVLNILNQPNLLA